MILKKQVPIIGYLNVNSLVRNKNESLIEMNILYINEARLYDSFPGKNYL